MKTKIFSIELETDSVDNTKEYGVKMQRLVAFEERINKFMEENPDFIAIEWLQSSASAPHSFTRITAIAKTV